jgi:hypothetical protein
MIITVEHCQLSKIYFYIHNVSGDWFARLRATGCHYADRLLNFVLVATVGTESNTFGILKYYANH